MSDTNIIRLPKSMVERVRIRPAVIFGSAGIDGCIHVISEIIKNSIEEAKKGFGDRIIITRYEDNSFEVIDFGRGISVEYNEKAKKFNWDINFCQIESVSYFEEEKHEYQFLANLDECELFFAQAVSEYMDAEICRNNCKYILHFEKGENIGGLSKETLNNTSTGTRIKFKLDNQVFDETFVSFEKLEETIDQLATCNAGITLELHYKSYDEDNIDKEYCYCTIGEKIKRTNKLETRSVYEQIADFSGEDHHKRLCHGSVNIAIAYVPEGSIRESYFNHRFLKYGGIVVDETERLIKKEITERFGENIEDNILEMVVKHFSIINCVKMEPEIAVMWTNGSRSAIMNPIVGETVATEFVNIINKIVDANLNMIKKLILNS